MNVFCLFGNGCSLVDNTHYSKDPLKRPAIINIHYINFPNGLGCRMTTASDSHGGARTAYQMTFRRVKSSTSTFYSLPKMLRLCHFSLSFWHFIHGQEKR